MEGYILDSLLRRIRVFDSYESFVWTERFQSEGDFELDLKSTPENRNLFTPGTLLAINNSYRVMEVETSEDTTNDDGKEILKVVGFSLEDILNSRVAMQIDMDDNVIPTWNLDDTPGNICRTIFDYICRPTIGTGAEPKDAIPLLQPGSIMAEDTIDEESSVILLQLAPEQLGTVIKNIIAGYELGYRLIRNFDMSQLYFDIYAGSDRTTRQTTLPPVVFSPYLDNLQNTTELVTIQDSKNVAYVFSTAYPEINKTVVYDENIDPDIDGFDRRVMVVSAEVPDTITEHDDIVNYLIQAGQEALRANRAQSLFDGEISEYSQFKYGVDYNLGDVVEMRNKDGIVSYKRVTEQIFVSDDQGERSYPTLSEDIFAGTDTWISWANKDKVWLDYDSEDTAWADM